MLTERIEQGAIYNDELDTDKKIAINEPQRMLIQRKTMATRDHTKDVVNGVA